MRLLCVLGTRPEIIKTAPVIFAAQKYPDLIELAILHTGQHYDSNLDKNFFQELVLPQPRYFSNVGGKPYGLQVNLIVQSVINAIFEFKPDVILAQGDTTSVCGAALAANRSNIPFAHQEAGLRSGNLAMLEEVHRIIADSVATHWYPPTEDCANNLKNENIQGDFFVCGNSVVDTVNLYANDLEVGKLVLDAYNLESDGYILLTAHRRETVGSEDAIRRFVSVVEKISESFSEKKIIFPIHPNTQAVLRRYNLVLPEKIFVVEPVGYREMLALEQHASVIVTDSGGIQEEACILRRACVTLREETERPETLDGGMNILVGLDPTKAVCAIDDILKGKNINWSSPFGDGKTGERIIEDLIRCYEDTNDN